MSEIYDPQDAQLRATVLTAATTVWSEGNPGDTSFADTLDALHSYVFGFSAWGEEDE